MQTPKLEIDGHEVGTGLLQREDVRDNQYPALLGMPELRLGLPLTTRRRWTIKYILDQGPTSACVGYTSKAFLMAPPKPSNPGDWPHPHFIYDRARQIDGFPQNDTRDIGTTIRAGMQVLQEIGKVRNYLWAHTVEELSAWVRTRGTAVIGVPLYEGMLRVERDGYMRTSGPMLGHHAMLVYGADASIETLYIVSSWGYVWAQGGRAMMSYATMDNLISQGGEICLPTEIAVRPLPAPVAAPSSKISSAKSSASESPVEPQEATATTQGNDT